MSKGKLVERITFVGKMYSNLSSCNAILFLDDKFVTSLFESLMDLHILVSSANI